MYLAWLVVAYATIVGVFGAQAAIQISERTEISVDWNFQFSSHPAENSTSQFVFDTISSLLQHWPNTRYRNGHNVVPGTVAQGTLLYHGTFIGVVPKQPDWIATDPEHSLLFCRGNLTTGCWHLTLVASRPLQVLYFDGSSAAKMQGGPLDSQDIVIWGEVKPDRIFDERKRIEHLCEWGRAFGLDGFVRMEMDFEIMLCDFTAGVEIVSFLKLVPAFPFRAPTPPVDQIKNLTHVQLSMPILDTEKMPAFEVIESGSWHNHYPGETRIKLDISRLVSFYDTSLVPSLVPHRQRKKRYEHRLQSISRADVAAFQSRLHEALEQIPNPDSGSSIDWQTLIKVIVKRFADRLELVQYLLNTTVPETPEGRRECARKVQSELRVMLRPYILHSATPPNMITDGKFANNSWAVYIFKHCATTHTTYITSSPSMLARMTVSEQLVLKAVQDTNREICRVIVRMWADGVLVGLDPTLKPPSASSILPEERTDAILQRWQNQVDALIAWLDWSVWVKCEPACGFEEICYLPTWPFFKRLPGRPRMTHADELQVQMETDWEATDRLIPEREDWMRPRPECIQRI